MPGSLDFTVSTASRVRRVEEWSALPFVENDRKATRGSVSRKMRAFLAASMAISANWDTVGNGTTAQSAKTKSTEGSVMRKKLETTDDPGRKPMQRSTDLTVSAVVVAAPPTKPSASPARTIVAAK
jgi:hypothetical protein